MCLDHMCCWHCFFHSNNMHWLNIFFEKVSWCFQGFFHLELRWYDSLFLTHRKGCCCIDYKEMDYSYSNQWCVFPIINEILFSIKTPLLFKQEGVAAVFSNSTHSLGLHRYIIMLFHHFHLDRILPLGWRWGKKMKERWMTGGRKWRRKTHQRAEVSVEAEGRWGRR